MAAYVLSKEAEADLIEIAQYTLNKWGDDAFQKYKKGLSNKFNDIGNHKVLERQFSKTYPQIKVTKYRYHFIFYITEGVKTSIIIAVIHEQRDIVKNISNRLQ